MWFIIKVESPADIGKNEQRRIHVHGGLPMTGEMGDINISFSGEGVEVHPATEENDSTN